MPLHAEQNKINSEMLMQSTWQRLKLIVYVRQIKVTVSSRFVISVV